MVRKQVKFFPRDFVEKEVLWGGKKKMACSGNESANNNTCVSKKRSRKHQKEGEGENKQSVFGQ